jgi:hypothetical protein
LRISGFEDLIYGFDGFVELLFRALARGREAREPGEDREDELQRLQVPIVTTEMVSPQRPRPRFRSAFSRSGRRANRSVEVVTDFVK